ncbi:MAG: AI-2E family transporter [Daejeonella sp.]|uniref:AI-2E family transporter n=1 Tax=Daejeonella sp. TaxID=2805397 RepID=UPI003C797042
MKDLPLTVRRSIELLGLFLLGALLVLGQGIIMPVLMAFFISIMLLPVYRFLRKWKVPEVLAIFLPILMVAIFIALIVWFFSAQVSMLVADFPSIQRNVSIHLKSLSDWINQKTDFSTQEQVKFLQQQSAKMFANAGSMAGGAAGSVSSVFIFMGLVPIYIYLFLFYKNLLLRFVFIWFETSQHKKVEEVMKETEVIIKSYLIGLVIQISYITILLGGILMLIGIEHALLIGAIFAVLNLIPYVGALIGNLIGVLLTLTSSPEIGPIFTVLGVIAFVQFLDNNILMPRIVGSKVRINAFAAILGVFIGGTLAGISGMFLALPMIAVLKIIFDRSDIFKPWGVLLGDERPIRSPMSFLRLRKKSKKVTEEIQKEDHITPVK